MRGRNTRLIQRYFPGYRPAKAVYHGQLDQRVGPDTVWLDVGCGKWICSDRRLNSELPQRARLAVGADRDPQLSGHSSMRHLVLCDAAALPFRPGVFSLVTTSMVVEHLEDPEAVFREVGRVTCKGGHFVVITPNRFNYGMLVAAMTPHRFHVYWKKLVYYLNRREWRDFEEDIFPTWYRANSIGALRRLSRRTAWAEERLEHLSFAHSFGFVPPLYALSLLFERLIDRMGLHVLKADILGVFVREGDPADSAADGASRPPEHGRGGSDGAGELTAPVKCSRDPGERIG